MPHFKPLSTYRLANAHTRQAAHNVERLMDEDIREKISLIERICRDGIPPSVIAELCKRYSVTTIKSQNVVSYIYGLLHCKGYRRWFSVSDIKRGATIPFVNDYNDFLSVQSAGVRLLCLHRDYRYAPAYDGVTIKYSGYNIPSQNLFPDDADLLEAAESAEVNPVEFFKVEKMHFAEKSVVDKEGNTFQIEDKSVIVYNTEIRIENIPEAAYDFVVNGKSAIEWLMERFSETTGSKGEIMDIPRELAIIHKNPRYILNLLLSIITVSCQTMDIVNGLPPLENCTTFNIGGNNVLGYGGLKAEDKERVVVNEIHVHGDTTFSSIGDINISKVENKH